MRISYSDHAKKRMGQRGITELEVEHVLRHPHYTMKSLGGSRTALGEVNKRTMKIVFVEREKYLKIITVI